MRVPVTVPMCVVMRVAMIVVVNMPVMCVIVLHCHHDSVAQQILEFSPIAVLLPQFHIGAVTWVRWEACPDRGRQSYWRR